MYRSVSGTIGLALLIAFGGCGGSGGECAAGEWSCSADARELTTCADGHWQVVDCLATGGALCEAGACVLPWRYGSPVWPRVEDEPRATAESLADKAAGYEEIARRLHIHPQLKWISGVSLPCDGADCSRPLVAESAAGWQDVESWHSGENDGLWSALYLAAEAFRYGATRETAALETIRLLLEGEAIRMRITGVPGLFTRQFIPPGVNGLACPSDVTRYVPDIEKDDNQWVRIGTDGCVQTVDRVTQQWVTSDHCGLAEFAGWCWLDNVSQDEYSGHMLALGVLALLVDDPEVQATVQELLGQVGHHLVDTRLQITDWDGRRCEHGRLYAMALDNLPGLNAGMALSYTLAAATATGDPELWDFYDNCLLQRGGERDCIQEPTEAPRPYTEHLPTVGLYVGPGACGSNWNNISMHLISLHLLGLLSRQADVLAAVQQHLEQDVFAPSDTPRPLRAQHNAWIDFIYAAHRGLDPAASQPAAEAAAAVEDGIRMLRQFPASKHNRAVACPGACTLDSCVDRFGDPILVAPREMADRCLGTFTWWGSPYDVDECAENLRSIGPPGDYLLAYWMGRYYGFITEDM